MRIFVFMKAKINLSIDAELVYKIKAYAEEKHTSVSELVEEYFKSKVDRPKKNSLIELVKGLPKVDLPYGDDVNLTQQYYEEKASEYGL